MLLLLLLYNIDQAMRDGHIMFNNHDHHMCERDSEVQVVSLLVYIHYGP